MRHRGGRKVRADRDAVAACELDTEILHERTAG